MRILGLDTAMGACSAAVIEAGRDQPLADACIVMERGHAETLAPMVAEVMRQAGLGFSDIARIAVTTGPGTFTGTRIGLSFAQGLARACGAPVIGIDCLSAIAANEPAQVPLLVASDAGNGQVYAARFDAARQEIRAPHVATLASATLDTPLGSWVIGTAAEAVVTSCNRADLTVSRAGNHPIAARFARLAITRPDTGLPAPLYLRAPDAKPQTGAIRAAETGFTIETASPVSASLLAHLHAEAFGEGWSTAAFADLLATPGAAGSLALMHGEPAAFLLTRRAADEAEIITIGTRPAARRHGLARHLLLRHLEGLAQAKVRKVFLEVAASNIAAQALYAGLGFREAGRRKDYYARAGGREDAIVYSRELSA